MKRVPTEPAVRRPRTRNWAVACASLFALLGCGTSDGKPGKTKQRAQTAAADSMGALPTAVLQIPTRNPPDLIENSALVSSISQPGVLFSVNDAGNEPMLFALDTAGAFRGRWRVRDAANHDWEAASRGPCTRWDRADSLRTDAYCLYIGDVGDNEAGRSALTLYQIDEPTLSDTVITGTLQSHAVHFRYPDRPHDVEAMYVGPHGTVYLITKRKLKDGAGILRPALVFSIPARAWYSRDTATATLLDSLPIVPGTSALREITDAALSPDARYLAVRTYGQVFTFATDSSTGQVRSESRPTICNIDGTERQTGEGMTWHARGRTLLLSSEGSSSALVALTCPLPSR